MGKQVTVRDTWREGEQIAPRSEYLVFHQLVQSAITLNKAILAMIERYPFLFGTQDKASIDRYLKSMDKIRTKLPQ